MTLIFSSATVILVSWFAWMRAPKKASSYSTQTRILLTLICRITNTFGMQTPKALSLALKKVFRQRYAVNSSWVQARTKVKKWRLPLNYYVGKLKKLLPNGHLRLPVFQLPALKSLRKKLRIVHSNKHLSSRLHGPMHGVKSINQ